MEIRKAKPSELNEIIRIMIESGEWDEWKLSYLRDNWKETMKNLKKIIENEELGIFYVIEKNDKLIGVIPLVRIGTKSLFFTCAGILEEYKKDVLTLLDRELFEIVPSQYKILMNYARPTSKGAVPRFLKNEFGIKDNKMMWEKYNELPDFIKSSIKLSPVYYYMEKRIVKKSEQQTKIESLEGIDRKIENFVVLEFMEAFDIQDRNGIEKLYSEYGMKCEIKSMKNEDSLVLLMNYPFGITPSGYISAAYIFGRNFESLIDGIENYYSSFDYKRVLCFVDEDQHRLLKREGFEMIKPLQQIFYFIPENCEWRRKYKELL